MSLVIPQEGTADRLATLLAGSLILHLFKNNYTPVDASTLASFTECTFPGYVPMTLTGGAWTVTAGIPSAATYPAQAFVCTGGGLAETPYGYYVEHSGKCVWAERFPAASIATIQNPGDSRTINPRLADYYA